MAIKILLSGYYGFGNTGDEAILEAVCQELRAIEPTVELGVLMDNTARAQQLGLTCYPRKAPLAIWQALRSHSLLISGGGGLLQDSTGIGSVIYYGGLLFLARLLGRRTMILCQGFGPVRSRLGRAIVAGVLPGVDLATWRDRDSVQEVQQLAPHLKSELLADPALVLEAAKKERQQVVNAEVFEQIKSNLAQLPAAVSEPADTSYNIVVTVREWAGVDPEEIAQALLRFADTVYRQEQRRVQYLLIPFQPSQDTAVSERLAALLPLGAVVVRNLTAAEIVGLIGAGRVESPSLARLEVEMVVAMRLHTVIFAASQGVPFLGLSYDPKVQRFCERAGGHYLPLAQANSEALYQAIVDCWEKKQAIRDTLMQTVPKMVEQVSGAMQKAIALAREGAKAH